MEKEKLILFVKAPVPGRVKTRLAPTLTYEKAAELYRSWSREIFKRVRDSSFLSIEIAYEPHPDFPTPEWLNGEGDSTDFFLQNGAHLGEKLLNAFGRAFENGTERAVIIGSDSPGLPVDYIKDAFVALEKYDLVLGPTKDGGYYLVGLKNKADPALFKNIAWSSSKVLFQTMEAAKALNFKLRLLPEYFDVDVADDLKYLKVQSATVQ